MEHRRFGRNIGLRKRVAFEIPSCLLRNHPSHLNDIDKMKPLFLAALCCLTSIAFGQMQFFEQLFNQGGGGGGQQHHHQHDQPQNVASNSEWYQRTYESGMSPFAPLSPFPYLSHQKSNRTQLSTFSTSALLELPLPRHPSLCPFPAPLPLRVPSSGR